MGKVNPKELPLWSKARELAGLVFNLVRANPDVQCDDIEFIAISIPVEIVKAENSRGIIKALSNTYRVETMLMANEKLDDAAHDEVERALTLCEEVIDLLDEYLKQLSRST